MSLIHKSKVLSMISTGDTFKCQFIKKDGTLRSMICSFKEIRDYGNSLVTVWDYENDGYRYVNLDTLVSISFHDAHFQVAS
ncbi:MAG: hypothetical protein WC656_03665 [Sulfurimonas sp.]|jgi:hypothetical protein